MEDSQKVEMRIPSMSEFVGVIRLAASGIANRLKFNHEEIEDIKIAVSEACTNAVQYAYPDKVGEITVEFYVQKEKLEILIKDNGRGFDINAKTQGVKDADPNAPEKDGLGLGITFMRSLMDEVVYDTVIGKGTTVKMVKYVYASEDFDKE